LHVLDAQVGRLIVADAAATVALDASYDSISAVRKPNEQATGVATLNADAFNIAGLQELQLGAVELGGTGAVITEFSTDGTFTADSDNIVPTQKAIKTYIASQIGGGAGELNVNSITAGVVLVSTNEITTTTGQSITAQQKITFEKGVDGHPLAMNYFLQQ